MMPDGECRIHQMIFETMIDLLEYFRDNPIPLESSSTPPILLNEYVICMFALLFGLFLLQCFTHYNLPTLDKS